MSHGGKRTGAGRPFKDGIARKRQTVALREDILTELLRQAAVMGCSLSDRVNALLSEQLKPKPDQAAAPAPGLAGGTPAIGGKLKQPRSARPDPEPLPASDKHESVPSYRDLDSLVKKWRYRLSPVNRRTQEVQYWRKAYRQHKAFRDAVDRLAARTHAGLRDFLLDGLLPLGSHKEVLALAELPDDTLKRCMASLLKGERSLKLALGPAAETFRQIVSSQVRQADPLYTQYYFFEEL